MATNTLVRLISSSLFVALSASAVGAQEAPAAISAGAGGVALAKAILPGRNSAEAPPNLPQVSCDGHQLTISTDNSTLGSVFAELRRCIGVPVDPPDGSSGGRIFAKFGPGPARQVLESLLSSTEYNFVIESSDSDPDKIQRVLLMSRSTDTKDAETGSDLVLTPARRAWLQSRRNLRPAETAIDESQANEPEATSALAAVRVEPSPAEPTAVTAVLSGTAAPDPANASVGNPAQNATRSATTTTDPSQSAPQDTAIVDATAATSASKEMQQRINSMQQMFDQRKQMIQNQNAPPKSQ